MLFLLHPWVGFHVAVALAKGKSSCLLNGSDILAPKLKIGGPASKSEVQIWHWENGSVLHKELFQL